MRLITAIDANGVATRFFVGCTEVGDALAADLVVHGFAVLIDSPVDRPPPRTPEEMRRVYRIIALMGVNGTPS